MPSFGRISEGVSVSEGEHLKQSETKRGSSITVALFRFLVIRLGFNSLHMEDYRPVAIGAADHRGLPSAKLDRVDTGAYIRPSPGTKTVRRIVWARHQKFLALFKNRTDTAFTVCILFVQILKEGLFRHRDLDWCIGCSLLGGCCSGGSFSRVSSGGGRCGARKKISSLHQVTSVSSICNLPRSISPRPCSNAILIMRTFSASRPNTFAE